MTTSMKPTESKHHLTDAQDWWVPIFRGAWLIIVGAFAIFSGYITGFSLVLLFATGALVSGGVLMINGLAFRSTLPIIQGTLSLTIGLLALGIPATRELYLAYAIGLWAIVMGAVDLLVTKRHAALRGRNMLLSAGALSVGAGVLAWVAPTLPGVLTVTFFGFLGVIAGSLLVGFGMRRRRRKGDVSAQTSAHRDEERRVDRYGAAAHP